MNSIRRSLMIGCLALDDALGRQGNVNYNCSLPCSADIISLHL